MIRSIADLQQMKEAYLEKMGQYSHLCMVCYGTGCMSSGSKNVPGRHGGRTGKGGTDR